MTYEVERNVVTSGNEVKPLVLGTSLEITDHISTQVEGNAAEVGNTEHGHLNLAQVVLAGSVIGVVRVAVLRVVDNLIPAVGLEDIGREVTLDSVGS